MMKFQEALRALTTPSSILSASFPKTCALRKRPCTEPDSRPIPQLPEDQTPQSTIFFKGQSTKARVIFLSAVADKADKNEQGGYHNARNI